MRLPSADTIWLWAVGLLIVAWCVIGVAWAITLDGGHTKPHPGGNCDLWIKDATPTFVCVDRGEATVWRLHRDGSWQYIGPATNSNLGVRY